MDLFNPPEAQEISFNNYAADNTLRLVQRNECYLQMQQQAQCTPDPAGNFAGALRYGPRSACRRTQDR